MMDLEKIIENETMEVQLEEFKAPSLFLYHIE